MCHSVPNFETVVFDTRLRLDRSVTVSEAHVRRRSGVERLAGHDASGEAREGDRLQPSSRMTGSTEHNMDINLRYANTTVIKIVIVIVK